MWKFTDREEDTCSHEYVLGKDDSSVKSVVSLRWLADLAYQHGRAALQGGAGCSSAPAQLH